MKSHSILNETMLLYNYYNILATYDYLYTNIFTSLISANTISTSTESFNDISAKTTNIVKCTQLINKVSNSLSKEIINNQNTAINMEKLTELKNDYYNVEETVNDNLKTLNLNRTKLNSDINIYNSDYNLTNSIDFYSNITYIILFIILLLTIYFAISESSTQTKIINFIFILILLSLLIFCIIYFFGKKIEIMENFELLTTVFTPASGSIPATEGEAVQDTLNTINDFNNSINTYLSKLYIRLSLSDSIKLYNNVNNAINAKKELIKKNENKFNSIKNTVNVNQNINRYNIIFIYQLILTLCYIFIVLIISYMLFISFPDYINFIIGFAFIIFCIIILKFFIVIKQPTRVNTKKSFWQKPSNSLLHNL